MKQCSLLSNKYFHSLKDNQIFLKEAFSFWRNLRERFVNMNNFRLYYYEGKVEEIVIIVVLLSR